MDDFVSFPEMLNLAPFLAPNRNDYKLVPTSSGMRAPYMDWSSPADGPELEPVMYRLYGRSATRTLTDITAVVIHLGTMVGGHYVAYCLVDPEEMFGGVPTNGMAGLAVDGSGPSRGKFSEDGEVKRDKRVWCFCSE
jgi:ubiquitin carboxyl-terminal hydrolase 16/45